MSDASFEVIPDELGCSRKGEVWQMVLISNGLMATSVVLSGGAPIDYVVVPLKSGLTLLYGENGTGKTTILDGIDAAMSGVRRFDGEARLTCRIWRDYSYFDSSLLIDVVGMVSELTGVAVDQIDDAVESLRGWGDGTFGRFSENAHAYLVDWLRTALADLSDASGFQISEYELTFVPDGEQARPAWNVFVSGVTEIPSTFATALEGIEEDTRGILRGLPQGLSLLDASELAKAGYGFGSIRVMPLGRLSSDGKLRSARVSEQFDVEGTTLEFVRERYREESVSAWDAAELISEQLSDTASVFLRELSGADTPLRYIVNNPEAWIERGLGHWETEEVSGVTVPVDRLGSGWRRWASLAIRYSLSDVDLPALVLVDEPEAGLHPLAVQNVTRSLESFDEHRVLTIDSHPDELHVGCVVATTHHPAVLGARGAQLLHVTKDRVGRTQLSSIDQSLAAADLADSLGISMPDLLLMTKCFVLVEGEHDRAVIEAVFADELENARARVVVMGGASNVGHHINAEFFAKYTSARLVVVLDRLGAKVGELWEQARNASQEGDVDAALRAVNGIAGREGREADWLGAAGRTAVLAGNLGRISVVGLERPDILMYLPVADFIPDASSWGDVGRPPRGREFKQWLKEEFNAPVNTDQIRRSAGNLDDLADLPSIVTALSKDQ